MKLARPAEDAVISGEAIIRFLDVQMLLNGLVEAGSLKEVDVTLEVGTVTTAFDLETRDPSTSRNLQMELRAKKAEIVDVFKGNLEKKIAGLLLKSVGQGEISVGTDACVYVCVYVCVRACFCVHPIHSDRICITDSVKLPPFLHGGESGSGGGHRFERAKGQSVRGPNFKRQSSGARGRHRPSPTAGRVLRILEEDSLRRNSRIPQTPKGSSA